MREKLELPAVIDSELEGILEDFGLSGPLKEGRLNCIVCGKVMNWENLGGLKVSEGNLLLFCSEPECIDITQAKSE